MWSYLLHRVSSHLIEPGGYVRVMFFNFSSALNTIRRAILSERCRSLGVDLWITDYLTARPQYLRLGNCASETVSSTWCSSRYCSCAIPLPVIHYKL